MKKFKNLILALVALSFIGVTFPEKLSAQSYVRLNYDMSHPAGATKDFISNTSFRGGSFGLGHFIGKHFSVGLKIGLHSLYESLESDEENVSFNGKQERYIYSFPALIDLQLNFAGYNNITPYVGLAGGAYYFMKRTEIGAYDLTSENTWNLGFQPAAGFLIDMDENSSLNIGVKYNYIYKDSSVDHQGYFNITIGLMLYD